MYCKAGRTALAERCDGMSPAVHPRTELRQVESYREYHGNGYTKGKSTTLDTVDLRRCMEEHEHVVRQTRR